MVAVVVSDVVAGEVLEAKLFKKNNFISINGYFFDFYNSFFSFDNNYTIWQCCRESLLMKKGYG